MFYIIFTRGHTHGRYTNVHSDLGRPVQQRVGIIRHLRFRLFYDTIARYAFLYQPTLTVFQTAEKILSSHSIQVFDKTSVNTLLTKDVTILSDGAGTWVVGQVFTNDDAATRKPSQRFKTFWNIAPPILSANRPPEMCARQMLSLS